MCITILCPAGNEFDKNLAILLLFDTMKSVKQPISIPIHCFRGCRKELALDFEAKGGCFAPNLFVTSW
jgi:hypothetical protein